MEKLKILKRNKPKLTNEKGVKSSYIFQNLKFYDIITGQPPDIMHDMLEGTIPLNFYYMMVRFKSDKILTVTALNQALKNFNNGKVEVKDGKIPHNLFTLFSLRNTNGFKMSATHTWTLSRIFPLIFGSKLQNNRHYIHYLNGIKIFGLLMANSFTETSICEIEEKIKIYLSDFIRLYHKLTPKLHFLAHYGRMIRMFGPPKNCWVMRFEAKHKYFKKVQHSINNTINTSKSLAKRHQYMQVLKLRSTGYLTSKNIESGPINKSSINSVNLAEQFDIFRNTLSLSVKWVILNNIKYHPGNIVLTPDYHFKMIEKILIKEEVVYFILSALENISYVSHMNCFSVTESTTGTYTLLKCSELTYCWPMNLNRFNRNLYVLMKYPLRHLMITSFNPQTTNIFNIFN